MTARYQTAFDNFPLYLRQGPWSPVAYITLASTVLALYHVYSQPGLLVPFPEEKPAFTFFGNVNVRLLSGVCGVYMLAVLVSMLRTVGPWPLASYTMLSWNLVTLRHLLRATNAPTFIQEIFRFPALVGSITTTSVWWLALVPIIYHVLPSQQEKTRFVKFNAEWLLINIHLLNLPLSLLDQAFGPRDLVLTDLWIGCVVAFAYVMFYLLALDANGVHFYIIFSPRTHLFGLSASAVIALYYFIWRSFAQIQF
jgi:hypothetical protein